MSGRDSIARRLTLAGVLLLVTTFVAAAFIVDLYLQRLQDESQAARIEQQMVAFVALVSLDDAGQVDVGRLVSLAKMTDAGSGRFLLLRGTVGQSLWKSPSLGDAVPDVGPIVEAGQRRYEYRTLPNLGAVALLSLGLRVEDRAERLYDLTLVAGEDRSLLLHRRQVVRQRMAAAFGALAAVMLLLLLWLVRREFAPVRRLEGEIADIEAGRGEQLGMDYPPELAGVARSLNALLRSESQRMARYRDTLGNLAHSIKTPLAVMRSSLEGESPRVRAVLDREIDRIAQIVDRQLRRASGGGSAMRRRVVPVGPLVADLRATLLRVHAARDLNFTTDLQAGACFVGDAGDLTEMLGNVLDNACKWARLSLGIRAELLADRPPERNLLLSVCDDGPGIAPADRQRVLGRGVRGDERAPGHGLGLAMVAESVALYAGELVVEQCETLGGARIDLYLPGRLAIGGA